MVIRGTQAVVKSLDDLARLFQSQRLQHTVGLAGIRRIKSLTRSGKDADGRDFPRAPSAEEGPYSPGHRRKRERGHGAGKSLQVGHKDLIFSERAGMLDVLDHAVAANLETVELFFRTEEKGNIAGYLMAGAGKSRVKHNFFDLSDESVSDIGDLVSREIDQFLILSQL